ncbi:hypothetical protein CRM22_010866 [Opisthorchis felineus]|nr:hypothetical protein CRM22_010866 [Opisthorchis felineus]
MEDICHKILDLYPADGSVQESTAESNRYGVVSTSTPSTSSTTFTNMPPSSLPNAGTDLAAKRPRTSYPYGHGAPMPHQSLTQRPTSSFTQPPPTVVAPDRGAVHSYAARPDRR